MNRLYYNVKPFLPWMVRMGVRRWCAARTRRKVANVWPVEPGSEERPPGWAGWPGGKQFAFVLTHDVEGPAGLANSPHLMRLDLELGFRSSFNLIPEGEYRVSDELREELIRNGCEVGVHDLHHDGKLFHSRTAFRQHAERINQYLRDWDARGFRAGFMLHKPDWVHDLEIEYDASTFDTDPFEPQPDGAHTIFPFWVPAPAPANRSTGKRGYVELPYTLPQDSTLFVLFQERTIDVWKKKLDWIARHGGMVLVNTHPDYMCMNGSGPAPTQYPVALYESLLQYVRSAYPGAYWQPLPREVAVWYRESGENGAVHRYETHVK